MDNTFHTVDIRNKFLTSESAAGNKHWYHKKTVAIFTERETMVLNDGNTQYFASTCHKLKLSDLCDREQKNSKLQTSQ
jgi:hypothetical protein